MKRGGRKEANPAAVQDVEHTENKRACTVEFLVCFLWFYPFSFFLEILCSNGGRNGSAYVCSANHVVRAFADIACSDGTCDDATCCDITCATYTCSVGFRGKANLLSIVCTGGTCSDAICCDRV